MFVARLLAGVVLVLSAPSMASAQSTSPVMTHYRAYRAAMEHGDLAAAETAAQAALEASIARDGDGGNTGALALNLAQVRLSLGRPADAYEPALRAFSIASTGASTLDPLLASMVLGRAELTDDRWRQGRTRLESAIQEARSSAELSGETYNAAADLGRWLFSQELYNGALLAWEVAMQMADAAGEGSDYARAEARMGYAAALFVQAMADTIQAQARPTDTRLNQSTFESFDRADRELLDAQNIIGPHAYTVAEDGGLTLAQRVYASAMAWRTLINAFTQSRGLGSLRPRAPEFLVPRTDRRPTCEIQLLAEPLPNFPPGAEGTFTVGAVVVRLSVDEDGRLTETRVAAAIPERRFRDAVERVASQWRIETSPESAPNCRHYPIRFIPVRFAFR